MTTIDKQIDFAIDHLESYVENTYLTHNSYLYSKYYNTLQIKINIIKKAMQDFYHSKDDNVCDYFGSEQFIKDCKILCIDSGCLLNIIYNVPSIKLSKIDNKGQ